MKLKICGIQNQTMLEVCQENDVDYVGINFVSTSKRQIKQTLPKIPNEVVVRVGVFVDPTIELVRESIQNYDLEIIQLHGNESLEFIDICLNKFPNTKIWKALAVDENLNTKKLQQHCNKCDLILFDGKKPGSGNTIVDQEKLRDAIFEARSLGTKVGLAGGINTNNIIDFKKNFPNIDLFDTASGIEKDGHFSATQAQTLINNFNQ